MADATGAVTITGNALREDIDRLLMVLHRIAGVTHVINRLNVPETSQSEASRPSGV
jgi:hypothetical protein